MKKYKQKSGNQPLYRRTDEHKNIDGADRGHVLEGRQEGGRHGREEKADKAGEESKRAVGEKERAVERMAGWLTGLVAGGLAGQFAG